MRIVPTAGDSSEQTILSILSQTATVCELKHNLRKAKFDLRVYCDELMTLNPLLLPACKHLNL